MLNKPLPGPSIRALGAIVDIARSLLPEFPNLTLCVSVIEGYKYLAEYTIPKDKDKNVMMSVLVDPRDDFSAPFVMRYVWEMRRGFSNA